MAKVSSNYNLREVVLSKVQDVLNKPRVSAYTPSSLVEVVRHLLSLSYDDKKLEKLLYRDSGSRSWWLEPDLNYEYVVSKLQKTVDVLYDDQFAQ
jgi:hypothetical protein